MQKIKIGSQVKSLSIPRADVAVGTKARVILLDPNPSVKQCVYMEYGEGSNKRGRMVEFDQDSMIRYRVKPKPVYYFLVAHVGCDLKLNPVGTDFTIEYLQMSSSQYQKLVDTIDANGGNADFNTAVLSKEKRTNDKGQDVSTVEASFGKIALDADLADRIQEVSSNENLMAGLWNMLDVQTSMTVGQWEEFLQTNGLKPSAQGSEQALPQVRKPELPKPEEIETPQGDAPIDDDFGEFGDGGDFN